MIERRALAPEVRRIARALRIIGHLALGFLVADGVLAVLAHFSGENARRWRAQLVQWWSRGVCRILNVRIHVHGCISPAPTLYVANHISWLDIPCLNAVMAASFVSKEDVMRWPVIGRMALRADTIFIKRGEPSAATLAAEQMTWALTRKRGLITFPEGTTTDGRGVRQFHARLYQAAIRTHAPVQAVAIRYPHANRVNPVVPFIDDDTLIGHLWALLKEQSIAVTLTFCPPFFAVAAMPRRALAQSTRSQIIEALGLGSKPAVHKKLMAR